MNKNALPQTATVGILGAGAMGRGIAQIAAQAGHNVLLFDTADGFALQAKDIIAASLTKLVERNKFTEGQAQEILSNIAVVDGIEAMHPAALVVEAVIEDLAVKQDVFQRLETVCSDQTILASNTSSISITEIGASLKRPERFLGMHFFNPAPVMKLVEVIPGLATGDIFAQAVFATAANWGKTPVFAKSTPGFIVNRVARPFYSEAWRLLDEGVTDAATIDALMRHCGGFRMGPFELIDLIGHDVNLSVTRTVYNAFHHDPRYRPSQTQEELVAAGFLGRKSGRGIYSYGEDVPAIEVTTATAGPTPDNVGIEGDLGQARQLLSLFREAGIAVEETDGDGAIVAGDTYLFPACGLSATEIAAEVDHENVVTFDLAIDYAATDYIAIAKADQAEDRALQTAAGLFQALGKSVVFLDDTPGLVVTRILGMLANEAADAVHWGVAEASAVDTAMRMGVNYPIGPLAFADKVGPDRILNLLEGLSLHYAEDRYRTSSLLRRKAIAGQKFHQSGS